MTTPASPNPLSFSQINTEVGNASGATLNMGNAKLRGLFQDFSGEIAMSSGRNKSWPPPMTRYTSSTSISVPAGMTTMLVKAGELVEAAVGAVLVITEKAEQAVQVLLCMFLYP